MKKPEGLCTDDYYNIMKMCWSFEPEKRPEFALLHQWFSNYFPQVDRDKIYTTRGKPINQPMQNIDLVMKKIVPLSRSDSYEVTKL